MNSQEIRQKYLDFFEKKGHKIIPSASLIPEGDSTTLFTGSGMQPMVPYLLGQDHPLGKRIADSQKSFRAEDIEEVGDNRHTTFFEMLGNWSLGDYWKEEQLSWLFEFLIKEIGLDPNKIYTTVFIGNEKYNFPRDIETAGIYKKLFADYNIDAKETDFGSEENAAKIGMGDSRIFYYDKKNWWSRAGQPETMPANEPGGPNSEIFYEFSDIPHDTKYGKFCHPNCDCGHYLEIGNSVFMQYVKQQDGGFIELPKKNVDFGGGLERMAAASNNDSDVFNVDVLKQIVDKIKSLSHTSNTYAERIIADHIRASVFLISDGVLPSNKDRGYVLRRLIRRSISYGHSLTMKHDYTQLVELICKQYGSAYPSLLNNQQIIIQELQKEFDKFIKTLENGLKIIQGLFKKENDLETFAVNNTVLFDLYQSYGFPIELSLEQINTERASRGLSAMDKSLLLQYRESFNDSLAKHQELSRTSSAGQFKGGLASHSEKIVRLHTATHLLNAALRKVLGNEVWQKGSNITEERARFDFTHNAKLTDEQKIQVEDLVNGWVQRSLPVKREIMKQDEAKKLGAIGVFGEKYADEVSIYTVFDPVTNEVISREFCGGPHVENTGTIGKFKIQKEEAVSAGVRRIKASIV